MTSADAPTAIETVLCIPGPWRDRSELMTPLVKAGYINAGAVLMNIASRFAVELQFHDHDPQMGAAFRAAGAHWADSPAMDVIDTHESVIYLVGSSGSPESSRHFMDAAAALLTLGGMGVNVESSGVAHSAQQWIELTESVDPSALYRAFVVMVSSADEIYTCGLHHLGLPEVIASRDVDGAGEAVAAFSHYLCAEAPEVSDGQSFAPAVDESGYRIVADAGIDYGVDDLFTNPFGAWRLIPLQ